jgi:hypothetical protein
VWDNSRADGNSIFSGSKSNPSVLGKFKPNASGTVDLSALDSDDYPNGLAVKITATKGDIKTTLWIILINSAKPSGTMGAISYNNGLATINFTCKDSSAWKIIKLPTPPEVEIATGTIPVADRSDFSSSTTYDMSSNPTAQIKLICTDGLKSSDGDTRTLKDPAAAPVSFFSFSAQPAQITCPGGNTEATIKMDLGNTRNKVCKITASSPIGNPAAAEQMKKINEMLQSSTTTIYSSVPETSTTKNVNLSTALGTISARPERNVVSAKIKLDEKINGKRLFYYSTRFTLECNVGDADGNMITKSTNPNSYSSKSVDIIASCQGQN